ncbi:MAG: YbaB/EbfC family nucleoid-associated protein [candidate division KSB1 bacterium]|jgi:DNA-binding YbaB/EbfC family protein|nr:YbaB/EbfC family nucleoid-associated protein [candidate division KSB1 bacterium]
MNIGDFGSIFKNMQKLKDEIAKVQQQLEQIEVQGSAGGGMVTVTANARMQILQVKIEDDVYKSDDREMLENLIVSAMNQAIENAQKKANEQMSEATGGLLRNLPEGLNIPGII